MVLSPPYHLFGGAQLNQRVIIEEELVAANLPTLQRRGHCQSFLNPSYLDPTYEGKEFIQLGI